MRSCRINNKITKENKLMKKGIVLQIIVGIILTTVFLWTGPSEGSEYEQDKTLYDNHCQLCHGKDGSGKGPAAAAFTPHPKDFRTSGFWKHKDIDKFITNTIKNGLGPMPPISLSDEQMKSIIDYMSHTFKPGSK